jgi:predicted HTH domain antitoxin
MTEVTLSSLEETLLALHLTADELAQELRLAAAVKLHELGRLSSGAAANLAGIPRVVFLSKLPDYSVPTFQLTADELAEDLSRA